MIRLLKIEDLIGKTIVNAALYEGYASIFFNDGSFALLSVDRGYDYGDEEIVLEEDLDNLDLYAKRCLKFITETEYDKLNNARFEDMAKQQEVFERNQYETLKKKFENA
jgi:hypothetical protein